MFRFIYSTDLHGNHQKYRDVLQVAIENDIKLIHLGADILPKGYDIIQSQRIFLLGFLEQFYATCANYNIKILASFGNDDIYPLKKYFKKYGSLLDEKIQIIDSYRFRAYNYVPDYPFGLKTACKLDNRNWKCPEKYFSSPVDVDKNENIIKIQDINSYFTNKSTIEEDLKKIRVKSNDIFAIHCPPANVDLDICSDGKKVGSQAIYEWIKKTQPKICLCGHIHESYVVTNTWKAKIGNTLVIQPGQLKKTCFVIIEIDENEIRTFLQEI
jgi:uncharacterized protein